MKEHAKVMASAFRKSGSAMAKKIVKMDQMNTAVNLFLFVNFNFSKVYK